MIRDIFLYGAAGRRFGRRFRLDVASPYEAVRALIMLRPGLREMVRSGLWRVIVGRPHLANAVATDALDMRLGSQPMHLVPVTRPQGGDVKSIGTIIVGVVLVAAAIYFTGGLAAPFLAGIGTTWGAVAAVGVALIATGVAGLLQQQITQSATDNVAASDAPSFIFNGVRNNTQPGGPVPLVYGTMLTGTVTVGTSLVISDIPIWYA